MPYLPRRKARPPQQGRKVKEPRYKTARWQRARAAMLKQHPLCAGCGRAASVLDHIAPARLDPSRFWLMDNWWTLCSSCHNHKSATVDKRLQNWPNNLKGYRYHVRQALKKYAKG